MHIKWNRNLDGLHRSLSNNSTTTTSTTSTTFNNNDNLNDIKQQSLKESMEKHQVEVGNRIDDNGPGGDDAGRQLSSLNAKNFFLMKKTKIILPKKKLSQQQQQINDNSAVDGDGSLVEDKNNNNNKCLTTYHQHYHNSNNNNNHYYHNQNHQQHRSLSSQNSLIFTNNITCKGAMDMLISLFCIRNENIDNNNRYQQHHRRYLPLERYPNRQMNRARRQALSKRTNRLKLETIVSNNQENSDDNNDFYDDGGGGGREGDDDDDILSGGSSSAAITTSVNNDSATVDNLDNKKNLNITSAKVLIRFIDDEPCRIPIIVNNEKTISKQGILRLRDSSSLSTSNQSTSSSSSSSSSSASTSGVCSNKKVHFAKPLHTFALYNLS